MQSLNSLLNSHGFKATQVSQSEFEDGIGACAGLNFVKNETFYTPEQAATEAGYELEVTSGKLQAKNQADAIRQAEAIAKSSGVKAVDVRVTRMSSNVFSIISNYIK